MPHPSLAVGFNDDDPPTPTETTTECPDGTIYDDEAEACVAIEDSNLSDEALYGAARELAYAERYDDALAVLAIMSDQASSPVQTYLGFVHRKLGNIALARTHYDAALVADPDNLLARSYLGMFHLELGETASAQGQLDEIRARGGTGGWPERALSRAIVTGFSTDY